MSNHLRAASYVALLATGCLLTLAPARAQSVYGSIFGTVTDTTGAVIPGATVTVTDEAKGTVVTVVSNGTGDYTVSHLVPDTYDLKVEIKGFSTFISKGITVLADTSPRVDAALTVGGAGAQTVEVDADTVPQLKTDRADVSTVFNEQQTEDLPVGDQNFTNLQLLLPGAQILGWSHASDENPQASKQIQVNGQAFGGVAYELDGTDNQDAILGIIVVNPPMDSITETKITTQNFDAELGKAVASAITAQTRSGSNTYHGEIYDFRTGNANLALEPYSQSPATGIPAGLKNRYGASGGGRILRDRLFGFGYYEAQRQKVGVSASDTLPTPLLTETCLGNETGPGGIPGCDFSEYLANLSNGNGTIYDQSSGSPVPYPKNVIPAALVSQQWKNVLTYLEPYTKTETGGNLNGLDNNFHENGTGTFNTDLWGVRIDGTINSRMNAFARFTRFTSAEIGAVAFGALGGPGFGLGGYGGNSHGANDNLATGIDYVFNPKLVMDLRGGYYRYNVIDQKYDQGTDFADTLGIPGINIGGNITSGSPGFFLTTLAGGTTQPQYGAGLNINRCNCPLIEREDQFQIVNNWTKTIGNHSIKMGADLRYARNLRVPSDDDRAGVINFSNGPTSDPSAPFQGGLSFATFALGDVTSFSRYVSTSTNAKEFQKRLFFYAQDTWRATSKLTLNLGVRWELYFPEAVNGKGNGALLNIKDGYLHVAGIGGIGTNMGWSLDEAKQFEPRIGLAYQIDPKTVIRAGYGRSFDIGVFGSIFGHAVTQNVPVLAAQNITNTINVGQAFCIGSPTDNPGCNPAFNTAAQAQPAGGGPIPYTPPAVPANGLLPNPGSQVQSYSRPNPLQLPSLDAWNLSVQRALTPSLSLQLAYVGNKGTHTLADGDDRQTSPAEAAITLPGTSTAYGQSLSSVNGQTLHFDPSVVGNNISASGGVSNQNLLNRYYGGSLAACKDPNYTTPTGPYLQPGMCGWTSGIFLEGDDQNTNFNSMQVTLTQAMWHGLTASVNYAWQSAFDSAGNFSTWNKSVVYGRDSDTRNNQVTAYGSYQLPFGKGKQFVTGASRALDLLIGGYQLSGTMSLSTGLPFGLSSNCPLIPGSAPCYANYAAPGLRLPTHLTAFDPVAKNRIFYQAQTLGNGIFTAPPLDTIGNAGRNTYWGPGFFNTDLSLQKKFNIAESVTASFRFDAYNAVNHINPGTPGGYILSPGTITGEAPSTGPGPRQLEFSAKISF